MTFEQKPTFNVCEPFQNITIVQMNRPFVNLMIDFIDDMNQDVKLANEIIALKRALESRDAEQLPSFRVYEQFQNVIAIPMDSTFSTKIADFIEEMARDVNIEVELQAFEHALRDPAKAAQIRREKRRRRSH